MNYFINVQGGLGLNIGLASFLTEAKKEHKDDKYYICSPYYDIFQCCEAVDGVYTSQQMRDFIFDAKACDGTIVNHRLYDISDFIFKRLNYSQAWAQLLGYEWEDTENGTRVKSILKPYSKYPALKQKVDEVLNAIKKAGFEDFIIIQGTGGQTPLQNVPNGDWSKVPYDYQNEPLKRHYPIEKLQKFCDLYHKEHPKTAIVNYGLPNEPAPEGEYMVRTVMPYLAWYELAKFAKEAICIDSSFQHLVAGICPTTVIWAHSKPNNFGYSYNKNIEQKCRTDDLLYFTPLGPSGALVEYIEPEELLKETNK